MVTKDADGNVIKDYFNTDTDTYQLIARLNNLRSQYPALQYGTQREMWTSTHFYAFSRRIDSGENEGQELICAFRNAEGAETVTMSVRAESTLTPGTVLVNTMDENDRIAVSSDGKVSITLNGNQSKIYAPAPDSSALSKVIFTIHNATTAWGENIYIAGNTAALGNWNTDLAAGPAACPDYPTWVLTTYLPTDQTIEFKAIRRDSNGKVTWQNGNNHTYTVPANEGNVDISW